MFYITNINLDNRKQKKIQYSDNWSHSMCRGRFMHYVRKIFYDWETKQVVWKTTDVIAITLDGSGFITKNYSIKLWG